MSVPAKGGKRSKIQKLRISKPGKRGVLSSRERAAVRKSASNRTAAKQTVLFGVEIGGTKIQVVAGNEQGKILLRERFIVAPERGAAGILSQIKLGFDNLLQKYRPLAAAIGFGGPLDWRTGVTCRSHQVEGWTDFALGDWARKLLHAPIVVDNDANIAAVAEALAGAGAGRNPVCYVTLGSGVGGGLVLNQAIYHGAKPGESEIGHVRLDRSGTTVEQRCSGWAVDKKIRALCCEQPEGALRRLIGEAAGGEAKWLAQALQEKDALAGRILSDFAEDLAFGLSHVTHLFHPEVIVLGGGLSFVGEPLQAAVASKLDPFIMEAFRPGPQVRLARLGEDVVPIGCLFAARQLLVPAPP